MLYPGRACRSTLSIVRVLTSRSPSGRLTMFENLRIRTGASSPDRKLAAYITITSELQP